MGLLPGFFSFKVWKGATFTKHISLKDSVGGPIDVSDYSATLTAPGLTLTEDNGLILTNDGIDITITSDQTEAITWKRANYQLIISADKDYPILTGQIIVLGI